MEEVNKYSVSIPPAMGSLLQKLEFLSMIEKGKKPCMYSQTFVDANSWSGILYRMLHGENKQVMMLHIQNIIEEAIRGFIDYPLHKKTLLETLIKAKRGIENLSYTYNYSPDTIANISVLMRNIQIQINTYNDLLEPKPKALDIKPTKNDKSPSSSQTKSLPTSLMGHNSNAIIDPGSYVSQYSSYPEESEDIPQINSDPVKEDDNTTLDDGTLFLYPDNE